MSIISSQQFKEEDNTQAYQQVDNYASQVDHLVNTMNTSETNNQDYEDYKERVRQEGLNTNANLTETILQIGFKIDQSLDKIIKQLDTVLTVSYTHLTLPTTPYV